MSKDGKLAFTQVDGRPQTLCRRSERRGRELKAGAPTPFRQSPFTDPMRSSRPTADGLPMSRTSLAGPKCTCDRFHRTGLAGDSRCPRIGELEAHVAAQRSRAAVSGRPTGRLCELCFEPDFQVEKHLSGPGPWILRRGSTLLRMASWLCSLLLSPATRRGVSTRSCSSRAFSTSCDASCLRLADLVSRFHTPISSASPRGTGPLDCLLRSAIRPADLTNGANER